MPGDTTGISLDYAPPLDWEFLLRYLGARRTAGVEVIDGDRYFRSIEIASAVGTISVANQPGKSRLLVTVRGSVCRHTPAIGRRVRNMFDLDCDPAAILRTLGPDDRIGPLVAARPGIRVPGAWSPFELLVRTIVGQQVSVAAATTIMGRIASRHGQTVPGPDGTPMLLFPSLSSLARGDLDGTGIPLRRARALQNAARAIAEQEIPFADPDASSTDVREALLALPGIGPWTVEYFALRGLRDMDAWPATDLVLRRAVEAEPQRPGGWRPYRAYAAMHLWNQAATQPN